MELNLLVYLFTLFFGLCIGSFLNVVVIRYDEAVTILKERSHCMKCKKILKWYDLVPFFSFVLLAGKCRYCKTKISYQYPAVELVTGLIALAIVCFFGLNLSSILIFTASCVFILMSVFDFKDMEIPDFFLWVGVGVAIIYVILGQFAFSGYSTNITNALIGMVIFAGFPLLVNLLTRGKGMGIGDYKIGLSLGLIASYPQSVVGLVGAIFLGSIFGLGLIALGKKHMKDAIPFGPFLILGFFIAIFWGEQLWQIYFSL